MKVPVRMLLGHKLEDLAKVLSHPDLPRPGRAQKAMEQFRGFADARPLLCHGAAKMYFVVQSVASHRMAAIPGPSHPICVPLSPRVVDRSGRLE